MLERRKVYIEFTSPSSVMLVTPYFSREIQLKPEDDFRALDLISLKRPRDNEDRYFWAQINATEDEEHPNNFEYEISVFVLSAEKSHSKVEIVKFDKNYNKKKIEVSFKTKE